MTQGIIAVMIIFTIFVAPLWVIFHYVTKSRTSKMLSREDEQLLADLWQMAKKMEARIQSLETILNTESPDLRKKS
ncbi:MAG: envelope stress response membrane protein PspB [Deltaproteobacteria bacterium]|nr:envelope stress response membrane protein PspB [Deltaproteobacteria bacterium]